MATKKPSTATKKPRQSAKTTKASPSGTVYQFKITLLGTNPPIWRRIQVEDCTLDRLHEHVQTSMGWTNSHLHDFRIGGQCFGDPMLMQENMEELDYQDSTRTRLSDIVPEGRRRWREKSYSRARSAPRERRRPRRAR